MDIEKQTKILPVRLGYEENPSLPVTSFAVDVVNAQCEQTHQHSRAQLIYAEKGIMKVITPDLIWVVNPLQAIWVPSMMPHQVCFLNEVYVRNLFVDQSLTDSLPQSCFAFDVSSFVKELILKIVSFENQNRLPVQERRVMEVLLDELCALKPSALFLPTSSDERIGKVISLLLSEMDTSKNLEDFAEIACVSPRTLSRLFVKETGMTFHEWRTKLKIIEAIKYLADQKPLKDIAYDLGYESTSAFVYMFRKQVGVSPLQYLSK